MRDELIPTAIRYPSGTSAACCQSDSLDTRLFLRDGGAACVARLSFARSTEDSRDAITRKTAVLAGGQPDVEALLRKAGFDVRPVTFTAFDGTAAGKIQHFETYNRTAASQRVADVVAALELPRGLHHHQPRRVQLDLGVAELRLGRPCHPCRGVPGGVGDDVDLERVRHCPDSTARHRRGCGIQRRCATLS